MESPQEFITQKEIELQQNRERPMGGEGNTMVWYREAWTLMVQSDYPKKVFLFERFRWINTDNTQYRFSFYSYKEGRWVWARSCPIIPVADLQPLLDKARKEGTLL